MVNTNLLIVIDGKKTTVTMNGIITVHKTAFLSSLNFKDFINFIENENKKTKNGKHN